MTKKSKSIFLLLVGVGLFGGVVIFALQRQMPMSSDSNTPKLGSEILDLQNGWSRYTNKKLGIQFEYPSKDLKFISENGPSDTGDILKEGSVGFARGEDWYWELIISIQRPTFDTLEEWFAWREKQVGYEVYLESEIQIDGQRALVTYVPQEAGGHVPPFETRERKTVFSKEGMLYSIDTRLPYEEVKRIWDSFEVL